MLREIGLLAAVLGLAGCSNRPTMLSNPDPALRKSISEFAADAVNRFPYPTDAPRGGTALARAQVGYAINVLEVVNLSNETWTDVTVWVNESYVINVPKMEPNRIKRLSFEILYNDKGQMFPTNNLKTLIKKVEFYQNGKLYDVPLQLAD